MAISNQAHSYTDTLTYKTYLSGTHRQVGPDETLARVKPFMPVMGITRIANVTGLDRIGIPVVTVCRPNSRSLAVSQGKGISLLSAKASGVMESVESYHAERITLPLKLASYEELRYSHSVVDVDALPRIVRSRFHPYLRLLWIEGYDLLQNEWVWVPYELVHTDYTLPLPPGSGCFPTTSNGLASGNHILEAISHAICEIVERDSTTLWTMANQNDQRQTRVDLETVDDPDCREILLKYEQALINVAVWETTTDIGIPAYLCSIIDHTDDFFRLLYSTSGMGCHPLSGIALLRALTEAAQSRLTFISGSRDDAIRSRYENSRDPQVLAYHRALIEDGKPVRKFRDTTSFESETLEGDVAYELSLLQAAGVKRVIVIDLTRQEFDIPVVRVVIPGLESTIDYPGYSPGARARELLERNT
jgi:YcaO-like protein with predicted kinase domain